MATTSRKSKTSTYSSAFASSSSSFKSPTNSSFLNRPTSPTRVSLHSPGLFSPPLRFSLNRSSSQTRSISVSPHTVGSTTVKRQQNRTCMCSPTTHPGSFRCSLHKNCGSHSAARYSPNRLNARRSAMTNSLVRIRGVEGGDIVRKALAALIRPSSHQQKRRGTIFGGKEISYM
ncbi:unnamed protein product [Lupinus luteus]|uniref:Serine-rich protein-like protein n=1 Tax=Lupinus luteus TaxID=3873 RepID=A0AAV1XVI7_LUPLU